MARQLEHFPNLVSMFLTRAADKGDKPFLWAKRDGAWRPTQLERSGAAGGGAGRKPQAHRPRARRPGDAGQREPARMADRRPRHHGRRLRHGPDLHHQHDARSHPHPRQFGRQGGDRLQPETGQDAGPGGDVRVRMPPHHRHRGHPHRPGDRRGQLPPLGRAGRRRARHRRARAADGSGRARATSPASSTPAAPAARRAASSSTTARSSPTSPAAPTSSPTTSAGRTRSSSRSSPPATPTSIPAASISRSGSARRSITPRASRSSPPTSRKCGRRSWSWCRACSRCCARGSSRRSRKAGCPTIC